MSESQSPQKIRHRPSSGGGRHRPPKVVEPQTCPSYYNGYLPTLESVQRLRTLTAPHVESFNYFLEHGLAAGIQSLEPAELDLIPPILTTTTTTTTSGSDHPTSLQDVSTIQFWVEDVTIAKPMKSFSTTHQTNSTNHKALFPREARERGCMYSGTMTGTFCYRIIERRNYTTIPNKVIRIPNKSFGDMPIMVLSQACHLHNSTPQQLTKWKEEVHILLYLLLSMLWKIFIVKLLTLYFYI
jgi:DNA-directed RNA polymerase beta subunit